MKVFWANQKKGWAIRTLEDLPIGAFMFEYVGKLLTNAKLLLRMKECMEHGDYTYHYAIPLDANWGSEEEINDGKALCLDGQYFGNISRFLNHKCEDATLIDMLMKMGHHVTKYYHVKVLESYGLSSCLLILVVSIKIPSI
jgi:hypothetical protein